MKLTTRKYVRIESEKGDTAFDLRHALWSVPTDAEVVIRNDRVELNYEVPE